MKLVQKGNRQLRIQDDQLENMLATGYTEVDEKTGKFLKKEPKDALSVLKKENDSLKKENDSLKKENDTLKQANKELTEKVDVLTKQLEEQPGKADQ